MSTTSIILPLLFLTILDGTIIFSLAQLLRVLIRYCVLMGEHSAARRRSRVREVKLWAEPRRIDGQRWPIVDEEAQYGFQLFTRHMES